MYRIVKTSLAALAAAGLGLTTLAVTLSYITTEYAYAKGGDRNGGGNGLLNLTDEGETQPTDRTIARLTSAPAKTSSGYSWRTRLDDGELSTPSSELGAWNSAKRSPRAIANMVQKYRQTGNSNGAGGMIGQLVAAYEDYNGAGAGLEIALQDSVDDGLLAQMTAQRILLGELTSENVENAVVALDLAGDEIVSVDGSTVSCNDSGDGDCTAIQAELFALQSDIDALDIALSEPAIGDALDALADAADTLTAAQAMIVPRKTPELHETMKADIEDLLDISIAAAGTIMPPEDIEVLEDVEDVATAE